MMSIRSDQLTIYDAHFPLMVTSSPLTLYLIYSSIMDVFGHSNDLMQRLGPSRKIIRYLMILLLPLWISLSMVSSMSGTAFIDSHLCRDVNVVQWFIAILLYWWNTNVHPNIPYPLSPYIVPFYPLAGAILVYFYRHFHDIKRQAQETRCNITTTFSWLRVWFLFPKATWCGISHYSRRTKLTCPGIGQ